MAVVPICNKMPYKDQSDMCSRWNISYPTTDSLTRTKTREGNALRRLLSYGGSLSFRSMTEACLIESHLRSISDNDSHRETISSVCYASESSNSEKQLRSLDSYFGKLQDAANLSPSDTSSKTEQLRSLDSYFGKLQDDANLSPSDASNKTKQLYGRRDEFRSKKWLDSLNTYLGKLNTDAKSQNYESSTFVEDTDKGSRIGKPVSISENSKRGNEEEWKSYKEVRNRDGGSAPESSQDLRLQYDETSNLYLIGALVSINIAVFLFEMASPIRNSDLELFSLPLLYGAKVNHLILVGEWWRLVTPMFLHSGLLHMSLGCWGLLTFGPPVCRGYGSFTFFLIYILGGISGNLTSFLHTPELTVGGTGPVFAIIGAWLVYQLQNKDVTAKDASESIFQKGMIITALGFILSQFGPIDDWTHFGAAFTGIAYGLFTCPTLQLDDAASRSGQEEGITLVRRYSDPCKSLLFFTIFILVLSSLLFFIEPPLNVLASGI
ncbi:RHOMBOID-like protein 9, chloroplastic [Alnus glutinosa]|uniref:RHOMBOID-like protein 9, chloroplastic n=1 Tax=Alnus glutinosa TaxID=3517 RepID=UPI002D777DF2|nr:RHOMBOID-like protein 9, chloroplastic [Alnus glutinosa]XP_062152948.1 RHOMBOID-like protein 9, chloroplastic [Alnus glutinosa]XP_062152949.1 RHOMBOID-like protein 9, chloroplastic [Alnus glutinosa]